MTGDKESVQIMFDEIAERTGIPRVDLSEEDSAALPFGEDGMLLHVQYRREIPAVVFTAPLGGVPQGKKTFVFERLLEANVYWLGARGATLGYHADLEQVVLQFQEGASHLTSERLQNVLEGFVSVAIEWKSTLAKIEEEADEDAFPSAAGPDAAPGLGAEMYMQA